MSETYSPMPSRRRGRPQVLAWSLCAIGTLVFIGAAVVELTLNDATQSESQWGTKAGGFLWLFTFQAFLVVGALIASRRPENPIGWISMSAGLVANLTAIADTYSVYALVTDPGSLPAGEIAAWVSEWSWAVMIGLVGVFFVLLFPDGRLPSRRWWWVAALGVVGIVLGGAGMALRPGPLSESPHVPSNPFGVEGMEFVIGLLEGALVLLPISILLAATSLVLRFRRSSGVERLQLKWLAFAVTVVAIWFLGIFLLPIDGRAGALAEDVSLVLWAGLPISAGFAILKYRLYDIDRIINKTIVYGAVTAILVSGYAGVVLLIQALLPVSDRSPVAVAVSTLAMAALFGPLRRRIQAVVDKRFYRSRYNSALTLEGFGSRLRQQTDLDTLTSDLLGVIGDTVQPAHASLWLRTPE